MDRFDLIVIGSGAGLHIASQAGHAGWRVALVEQGPIGGTCLNNGCIPSKMLIHPADLVRIIQEARRVGVEARVESIDFRKIMSRMRAAVEDTRASLEDSIQAKQNLTLYRGLANFAGSYQLEVAKSLLYAPKIVIASGARRLVPPIPGLAETGYLDNVSLLDLEQPPRSLIIIGAGYIGCEYGHFFSSMGTEVTLLGRSRRILEDEDPEVSSIVQAGLSSYMRVVTGHEVERVAQEGDRKVVSARSLEDGGVGRFEADEILLAAGRRSNSDLLRPEKTGVKMDEHGWIRVNEFLETSKEGIWALGDATGRHMFRHTANHESDVVVHNILEAQRPEDRMAADFHAVPHAIFTHPQVAGVGLTEAGALAGGLKVLVGRARYTDVAKGVAMAEEQGFVKVVLEEETGRILGASVVGSFASELVQQVVLLMNTDYQDLLPLVKSQVIHPTISEVLVSAFSRLEHP